MDSTDMYILGKLSEVRYVLTQHIFLSFLSFITATQVVYTTLLL